MCVYLITHKQTTTKLSSYLHSGLDLTDLCYIGSSQVKLLFVCVCMSCIVSLFLIYELQVVLSKFVRQMGDLLPATLYIPYLRMLKGLANGPQCSHYCFSLLKTNGAPHGTHTHTLPLHFCLHSLLLCVHVNLTASLIYSHTHLLTHFVF